MRPCNQPHWKTAVRMPNAAAADISVVMEALIGMTTERNVMESSTKVMPMTARRNSGERSEMRLATSSNAAV